MLYRTVRPLLIEAVHAEEPMDVQTPDGPVHVETGEWLVRNEGGALFACDASYFARTFEPVNSTEGLNYYEEEGKPCGC